jgi:hypothetical protein
MLAAVGPRPTDRRLGHVWAERDPRCRSRRWQRDRALIRMRYAAATFRPLTEDELPQLHIALTARIDELDGDTDVSAELVSMLRRLDQDILEARRTV